MDLSFKAIIDKWQKDTRKVVIVLKKNDFIDLRRLTTSATTVHVSVWYIFGSKVFKFLSTRIRTHIFYLDSCHFTSCFQVYQNSRYRSLIRKHDMHISSFKNECMLHTRRSAATNKIPIKQHKRRIRTFYMEDVRKFMVHTASR